jgi:hypothetical protein
MLNQFSRLYAPTFSREVAEDLLALDFDQADKDRFKTWAQVIVVPTRPPSSTVLSRPSATESSRPCLRRSDDTEVD